MSAASLQLAWGLAFEDLYRREGLQRIDALWLQHLRAENAALAQALQAARVNPDALDAKAEAALLIDLAPALESFIAQLFDLVEPIELLRAQHTALEPLLRFKWKFVKRQALLRVTPEDLTGFDADRARKALGAEPFDELAFARQIGVWESDPETHAEKLEIALRYCAWAVLTEEGRQRHRTDVAFRQPDKLDPLALLHHIHTAEETGSGSGAPEAGQPSANAGCETRFRVTTIDPAHLRRRLDHGRAPFALTDPGTDLKGALDQTQYCIWCHKQGKDSCSKGLREKPGPSGAAPFKKSAFGHRLAGCPLEERISEFQWLKSQARPVAAFAMILVDNPMVAATGHRICNDCMKSCIYQKQTPVDIPQAETRTLRDVLALPWGFEIYCLLTRWNPLNLRRPLPLPESGRKVLVVGMGPAGFTLAHHLMNEGHTVVGIDGLKIEPLDARYSGVNPDGSRTMFEPIHRIEDLAEPLDERAMAGFGGVAEYGITVRWDKNFLKIIRLLLERRSAFSLIGGVRFGGTLTAEDAWALGFDHVALAIGAGKPSTLDIPNGLARGVRTASDFLMSLQLTGAAKPDSIANMQLRLPVVVIGGGLTAIDTATESLAYYVVQVEKFRQRHDALVRMLGEANVRAGWSAEETEVGEEFLAHARALEAERTAARAEGRPARLAEFLQSWGGVTIAYRKRLLDSPSYTLNHEEVEKALEEGIRFAEGLSPARIEVDHHQAVQAIVLSKQVLDESGQWHEAGEVRLTARTVFIAAGTQPNTVLAREDSAHFSLDARGRYFQAVDEAGEPVSPEHASAKPEASQVLLAGAPVGRSMSFFGDVHPSYFGNVVKAMGSAKQGYPVVSRALARQTPASPESAAAFFERLNGLLRARVVRVQALAPAIVEVVVHAPLAARHFQPGQFYRLQNFEALARSVSPGVGTHAAGPSPAGPDGSKSAGQPTRLAMEGLALTGAWVNREAGLVSTIVLEMGGSSDLCRLLEPGEPVVLMGPTGAPTEIAAGETVLLVGGGLGNAVLFSIGAAFRAQGSRVLYFAGYKKRQDRYKVAEIEAAADLVVWCCDEAPGFGPSRPQDLSFVGNIVQALEAYARGDLTRAQPPAIGLPSVDRLIAIGSDRMMAAVAAARHGVLAPFLKAGHVALGSINSPMQCMMKEICAQCLQVQRDPVTGRQQVVFSCFNQDQALDAVDFGALDQRLRQNSLQEKLTARWLGQCLKSGSIAPKPQAGT